METRATAAVWGEDARLTAWIPNQGAQLTKMAVAGLLGVKPDEVRIITPDVGGAFGAKFGADPEHAVTCWVAKQVGRPIRWSETRMENLLAMTHGRAQQQKVTIGGSRDGTVLAYRIEILQDCGAYPKIGAFLPSLTILMAPGPYAIPRAEAVATSVVTNTTPVGAYRGAGRPEATAAIDRAIDLFAAAAGVDPAEVRRKNLLPKFTEPHKTAFGALYDSGDYVTALEKALVAADSTGCARSRPATPGDTLQLAIGLPSYVEITGPAATACSRTRTAPSRFTQTARPPSSPAPHRTARAIPRCGRCWPAKSSASRSKRSPSVGRHRPGAARRWHWRLTQPAARRRRGPARRHASCSTWRASAPRRRSSELRQPGLRRGRERVHGER